MIPVLASEKLFRLFSRDSLKIGLERIFAADLDFDPYSGDVRSEAGRPLALPPTCGLLAWMREPLLLLLRSP
jgi:hypothetical protein